MNMTTNISERLQAVINHYYNGNKTRFAEKVGVLPQMVQQWLKKGISRASLQKICDAFPEVDKNWLCFGTGEMFGMGSIMNSPNSGNIDSFNGTTIGNETALVNALNKQIQDLKDQLDKKDQQIKDLIDLMMKK